MVTWILSRLFCHYWEVKSLNQTPKWTTHFLTKKEAYEFAEKNRECVVDFYINARPWYLIKVNKEHKYFGNDNAERNV